VSFRLKDTLKRELAVLSRQLQLAVATQLMEKITMNKLLILSLLTVFPILTLAEETLPRFHHTLSIEQMALEYSASNVERFNRRGGSRGRTTRGVRSIFKPLDKPRYSCARKKSCAQMETCREAYHHLEKCKNKGLDTDNDGVPCENICKAG